MASEAITSGPVAVCTRTTCRPSEWPPTRAAAATTHMNIVAMADLTRTAAIDSGQRAMAMAGVSPRDIDVVELYDANGTLISRGTTAAPDQQIIRGFRDTTTDGNSDLYRVKVIGVSETTGEYGLMVTRGGDAAVAENYLPSTALPLIDDATLGHIGAVVGHLYYYDTTNNLIRDIDPRSGSVYQSFAPPVFEANGGGIGLASTPTTLLVAGSSSSQIYEISASTGQIIRAFGPPGLDVGGMAYLRNANEVIVLGTNGSMYAFDYVTGQFKRNIPVQVGSFSINLAATDTTLLAIPLSATTASLKQIDPVTGVVTTLGSLAGMSGTTQSAGLGVIGGEVFVADGSFIRVYSLATLQLLRSLFATNVAAIGADGATLASNDDEYFTFLASAGDTITISTATPGSAPGLFNNTLDLGIELTAPAVSA